MKTISISKWVAAAVNSVAASPYTSQHHNPVGVEYYFAQLPRVVARRANPGLIASIPLGLKTAFVIVGLAFISSLTTFAQVNVPIGNLLPGEKITITFDVALTNPFPAGVLSVTNQGTLSGSNFSTVNSDDPQTAPVGDATITAVEVPPVVVTLPATGIGPTSATLNGSVNPNGLATKFWLQFGLTTNYNNTTAPNIVGSGIGPVPVSSFIPGLNPATTYHFHFVATNSAGTNFGGDLFFTTTAIPPSLLTNVTVLGNGTFQFSFTNAPGQSFTVLGSTNLSLPMSSWTVLGTATEGPAGTFQFSDPQATNGGRRFYRVRWP